MKKLINLIVMAIVMVACTKKEEKLPHTVVEGYVIHSGTKQPLDSVRVSIWDGIGTNTQNNYDTTYTNAQGFFHIEVDGNEPVMFLYKKNFSFEYSLDGAALGIIPLTVGVHKEMKFEMDAPAGFDPILINKFKNSDDLLKFSDYSIDNYTIKHGIESTVYWEHSGFETFRPYEKDPSAAIGDKYHLYMLEVTRNGNISTIVDSVYIKSFTICTDTIYY